MKNRLFFLFPVVLVAVLPACQNDTDILPEYAANARLKQTVIYNLYNSNDDGWVSEVYEYDQQGRIAKVSTPHGTTDAIVQYRVYVYSDDGTLSAIEHYNHNIHGFLNLQTQHFSYSAEGLLTEELIEYPEISSTERNVYQYEGGLLKKLERYNSSDDLSTFVTMEYNGSGVLTKENTFSGAGELLNYSLHDYKNGLRVESKHFTDTNDPIKKEQRRYDSNGNLIELKSINIAPWLSSVSFVMKYEYFD